MIADEMDVLVALDGCHLTDHHPAQTDGRCMHADHSNTCNVTWVQCHRPVCDVLCGEKRGYESLDEEGECVSSKCRKIDSVDHRDALLLDKSPGSKDSGAEDCGAQYDKETETWFENNFTRANAEESLPDEGIHEMHNDVQFSISIDYDTENNAVICGKGGGDSLVVTDQQQQQHDDYGTTDELDAALYLPPLLSTDAAAFPMLDSAENGIYDDDSRIAMDTFVGNNAMLAGDTAMLPEHDVEEQFLRSLPQITTSGDSVASGLADLGDQLPELLPSLQCFDDIALDSPDELVDDVSSAKSHSDCRTPRRCKIKPSNPYVLATDNNAQLLVQETLAALDECVGEDSVARRVSLSSRHVPVRRNSEHRRSSDGNYNLRLVRRKTSVCACCGGADGLLSAEQLSVEFAALHSLRRTVSRLLAGLFPQLPYPVGFCVESSAVDMLVDDVAAALRGRHVPPAQSYGTISQPRVVLCAQPNICMHRLHGKTRMLLSLLMPALQLNTEDCSQLSHHTTDVMNDAVIL